MYVITARLTPARPDSPIPEPAQFRDLLYAQTVAGLELGHLYCRTDDGVSAVLYVQAANLADAEQGTRRLLDLAIADPAERLTGWHVNHCAADLIPPALDQLIDHADPTDY